MFCPHAKNRYYTSLLLTHYCFCVNGKKDFLLIALNIEGISNIHVQLNRRYFFALCFGLINYVMFNMASLFLRCCHSHDRMVVTTTYVISAYHY